MSARSIPAASSNPAPPPFSPPPQNATNTPGSPARSSRAEPTSFSAAARNGWLPKGTPGRHGPGARPDQLDLIARARDLGYTIVYDAQELAEVPADTPRLLGLFASGHTFNDKTQPELTAAGLPLYQPDAPTLAQMTAKALELFGDDEFFLVVEEEGFDNFGNNNNAPGTLDALRRADETIGVALDFLNTHPDTLFITTADSEAGGMDAIGISDDESALALAKNGRDRNAAPYSLAADGKPFRSAPDRAGNQHPFVITWGSLNDTSGGILVRAAGAHADLVTGSFDNTDVYRVMRHALFAPPTAEATDESSDQAATASRPAAVRFVNHTSTSVSNAGRNVSATTVENNNPNNTIAPTPR